MWYSAAGRFMKRIFLFLFVASLVLLFQNCSNVGDIKLTQSSSNTSASNSGDGSSESGNGTGYGGKLGGVFYHYIPGYSCENKHSAFAQLKYTPTEKNSVYYQSQDSSCFSIPIDIPNTNIDSGSLQNKVIGYEEKIFEENKSNSAVVLTPEKIVEIWCVDQWVAPTIEVLSTYDNQLKQAQTEFYFQKAAKQSELNTARSTSLQVVNLKSQFFNLTIDKALPGSKTGTFQGRLELVDSQKNSSTQLLQCRLGGYLDARLWPAKAINYDNYVQSEWNSQDGLFYISSGLGGLAAWAENVFYTYSPFSHSKKVQVGRVTNSPGVKSFQFTQNHSKAIIKAQLQGDVATQLYSKNLTDSSEPFLLNNKLTDPGQDVVDDINISPDSRYIYYLDGAQEKSSDIEAWLRVVDTHTGGIRQINQDLPSSSDEAVRQFEVSYSLGKVIYATGFIYVDIWISDLFGGSKRKLDLSSVLGFNPANYFGKTNYFLEWGIKQNLRWIFVQDRYLVLSAVGANNANSSVVFVIDLLTEKITFSQEFNKISFLEPIKGLPAVMINAVAASTPSSTSGAVDILYLNLQTSQLRTGSELISDFMDATDAKQKKSATQFSMMMSDTLCAVSNESNLGQMQLDDFTWLVLNYNTDNVAQIYLKFSQSNSCQLINKLILDPIFISNIKKLKTRRLTESYIYFDNMKAKISSDKKNILLSIQGRIYLISTENRPVIEIYTALNKSPRFNDIGFIDNTKIYFSGQLIKDYINQTFIWSLPK